MDKLFISAQDLLIDSFRLATMVHHSGFRPSLVVGVWRGGTPVAIAVQEYLDYMGITTDHIAIRTSSYQGIGQQGKEVRVYGLDYILDHACTDDNLLLVDDVFDSGRSITAVLKELREGEKMPGTIRIATPWYKPGRNATSIEPDYYIHKTDAWLVFPHELSGLKQEEIMRGKPEVANILFNERDKTRQQKS